MKKQFSSLENKILVQISEIAEENDGVASLRYYVDSGRTPYLNVVLETFGTWNNAVAIVDYVPYIQYDVTLRQEDLLRLIKDLYEENLNQISIDDFKQEYGESSLKKINLLFGTWSQALIYAGITPLKAEPEIYSKSEMIVNVKTLFNKRGHKPLSKEIYMESRTEPSLSLLLNEFGSWEGVLRDAGIGIKSTTSNNYTNNAFYKEVFDSLHTFYRETGTIKERLYKEQQRSPSATSIRRTFGSWKSALDKSGVINELVPKKENNTFEIEAIASIKAFYKETGTTSERLYKMERRSPSATSIRRNFGTWKDAVKAAKLPSGVSDKIKNKKRGQQKKEAIQQLKQLHQEYGITSERLYKSLRLKPSATTIRRLFGDWQKALEAAKLGD